jgi:hypothetical protein
MQIRRPTIHVTLALLATLLTAAPRVATAEDHSSHASPPALVQAVRDATRRFLDINVATTSGGYAQFLGCVSGPTEGAMGVHFVNFALVQDPELNAAEPEALIYEFSKGRARLVGVEFIVDAAAWKAHNPLPPVLEGQTFQFVDSPNRFNLDPFYELHVWAWRDNPNGSFVDWNTRVSCEEQ